MFNYNVCIELRLVKNKLIRVAVPWIVMRGHPQRLFD